MEKKKNDKNYIIPAKFFKNIIVEEKLDVETISDTKKITKPLVVKKTIEKVIVPVKQDLTKPIGSRKRKTSFSLKSVERQKEINDIDVEVVDYSSMPQTPFTEVQIIKEWKGYVKDLIIDGKKSLASIMDADIPTVKNSNIHIALPNKLMESQLLMHKPRILKVIREKLDNYSVDLLIDVNEVAEKRYAYTPQEKYEKLKEKNPFITEFRKKLDLDI